MPKVLVVESSTREIAPLLRLLAAEGVEVEFCPDGRAAERVLAEGVSDFAAAFLLWNLSAPPFAFELLAQCRERWPAMPVVVLVEELNWELTRRVSALGATGYLQKPFGDEEVRECLREVFDADKTRDLPLVTELRARMRGESARLLAALRQLAKVIPHAETRVLVLGESGTGKELVAQAVHELGPRAQAPFIKVQISARSESLFESELFGHERGAFTGAERRHSGFFEQAGTGTLFFDEIGDLSLAAQIRLLRVIEEGRFRRLGGSEDMPFSARLICATHRNLAEEAGRGSFRLDLFQRLSVVTIHVPPLREREGDVELLARHFLTTNSNGRRVRFARETLAVLRSYPWPGNVRELDHAVKTALIACEGEVIFPQHLPLKSMGDLSAGETADRANASWKNQPARLPRALLAELARLLPEQILRLSYDEATKPYIQAFDRVYLPSLFERHRQNVTAAAKAAGWTPKTFRRRWKEAQLPPLRGTEEE